MDVASISETESEVDDSDDCDAELRVSTQGTGMLGNVPLYCCLRVICNASRMLFDFESPVTISTQLQAATSSPRLS